MQRNINPRFSAGFAIDLSLLADKMKLAQERLLHVSLILLALLLDTMI